MKMNSYNRFQKKVALITGAGRGLGRSMAERFANEGADIVVVDINSEFAEDTKKRIEKIGRKCAVKITDVTNVQEVNEMFEDVIKQFGRVDILINNAGVFWDKPVHQMTDDDWNKHIDINLNGVFYCTRRVVQEMLKQKNGKIVNIASLSGKRAFPNSSAYCASKGGIINMTRELGEELASKGINVNAIGPGIFETEMTAAMRADQASKEAKLKMIPKHRFGYPEEIAALAAFLCSDEAEFIVGQTIYIDGGSSVVAQALPE